jgi:GntR family transcriptional regulator
MALKYEHVASDVERRIREGEFKPHDQLPISSELCEQYDVSRITIKKALDELVERGLLVKRRGAGTFVKDVDAATMNPVRRVTGYTDEALEEGSEVETEVRDFSVARADETVAKRLRVAPGTFVWQIVRVRFTNGAKGLISYTWIPLDIVPGLTEEIVQDSLYKHVKHTLGLKIGSAHRTLSADMPTKEEREALRMPEGVPVFQIDQVVYLGDGRLFEYSVLRNDARDFTYTCVDAQ